MHLGLQAQGLLSIRAGQGERGVDPVARGHPFDPWAHRRHHPGGVGAGGVGQGRGGGIGAGPDVGLHRVDPDGVDLNQDLAGTYLGLRHFFQAHHLGLAECVDAYGLHVFPLLR